MSYTPDWESLPDALKRVIGLGAEKQQAQHDICRAVADRKIRVRVRIDKTDLGFRGQTFSGGNVGVPPHLSPNDFDWVASRPLQAWPIGPKLGEHYAWIGGWKDRSIDLIELRTADVTAVLTVPEFARGQEQARAADERSRPLDPDQTEQITVSASEAPLAFKASSLDAAIARCLAAGGQPGRNVQWSRFCDRVRDDCDGWADRKEKRPKRGFGDRTIKRRMVKGQV